MALTTEQLNALTKEIVLGVPSGLSGVVDGVDVDVLKEKMRKNIEEMEKQGIAVDLVRD